MLVYINNSHWTIANNSNISENKFSSVGIYYINNDIFIKLNRCKLFIRRGKAICLCVEMYTTTHLGEKKMQSFYVIRKRRLSHSGGQTCMLQNPRYGHFT